MLSPKALKEPVAAAPGLLPSEAGSLTAHLLVNEDEAEVMAFLNERPAHTFGLAGFIRSNGLASPHNRGAFYAARDFEGQLQGVALIGHAILFETRSEAAIELFAMLAQDYSRAHLILGEQEKIASFWHYYDERGQAARLYCREHLMEQRRTVEVKEAVGGLRTATLDDLDLVVPVHARAVFEESGINPLDHDPEGFRQRCARRIEQGRTWVWVEGGKLIFKAEIVADTPEVIYLEGIDVNPEERGKGYGMRCLSQLTNDLLKRSQAICLLVNEKNPGAEAFYRKAGFSFLSYYDTVFLQQEVN